MMRGFSPLHLLKMQVFPSDACTPEEVTNWITELIANDLLMEYEVEGKKYWHVTGWNQHQKIVRPYFKFPLPPNCKNRPFSVDTQCLDTAHAVNEHCTETHRNINRDINRKDISQVADTTLAFYPDKKFSEVKKIEKKISQSVYEVFDYWKTTLNHDKAKLDKKRIAKIQQALKLGFSVDELKMAIDGISKSAFHMGDNQGKTRYDSIELIFRDAEHIEKFIQVASGAFLPSLSAHPALFEGVV